MVECSLSILGFVSQRPIMLTRQDLLNDDTVIKIPAKFFNESIGVPSLVHPQPEYVMVEEMMTYVSMVREAVEL